MIAIFSIHNLINNFLNDSLLFATLAFTSFSIHLFMWIAPKTFFNLCWKITNTMPDNFDYDNSFSKLELCDIGILVVANILITISVVIT